jgi:cellulose synthase/poly-beta-1,6-N-acetylglucosamine synthase-like glycosyltransferase
MMSLLFCLWVGITALALLTWLSRHRQISRAARLMPPLHSRLYEDLPAELPSVSIVVAAKDEASNIGRCLRSLAAQDYPDFEIIAINDRSADRTGEMIDAAARDHDHLSALHVDRLRPGWFGKAGAMDQGVRRARGQWLCFTDADCHFVSRRALTVAVGFALEREADFLSVLPVHETNSIWERVIQPACSGVLMIWFNPQRVNDPRRPTAYANGAFILLRRSCYDAIGGYQAVKTEMNEDMHLARLTKEAGRRLVVVTNEDLYTVRMYESLGQIWSGWTRIFYGCFGTVTRLALSLLFVTVFSLLPWVTLLCAAALQWSAPGPSTAWPVLIWTAAAAGVAQISVMFRFYALNRAPPLYGLLYPVGAAASFAIMVNALLRLVGLGTITWRGTTYRGDQVAGVEKAVARK